LAKAINRTVPFISRFAKSEGLTIQGRKVCPEQCAQQGQRTSAYFAENGHPRGALGLKHTDAAKEIISRKSKAAWRATTPEKKQERTFKILNTRFANTGSTSGHRFKTTWKAAWREIAGQRIFFRSRWEFNYALYLQFLLDKGQIIKWEHEPEVFWFEGVRRGTVSYLPDFRVTLAGGTVEYHEVKGWMDPRSKTKIRRMAKYHPKIVLRVIDSNWFGVNTPTLSKLISGWESMIRPTVRPHTPELL
jgi:hypothetical protein